VSPRQAAARKKPAVVADQPTADELTPAAEVAAERIRDRIKEFRRVPAEEILDNEKNWRTHPLQQTQALAEVLDQIGIAGALTAYYSERNGGKLTLIDGHARRATGETEWPVLILDVNDDEADTLLATLDPLTNMAGTDHEKLGQLVDSLKVGSAGIGDMLQRLRSTDKSAELAESVAKAEDKSKPLPEMELQPFEHYDYVMLVCRTTHDWMGLQELLGMEQVQFTMVDGSKRVGLGRVIDASRVVELLRERLSDDVPVVAEATAQKEAPKKRRAAAK